MSAVAALLAACPPPAEPHSARGDWAAVEAALGPLPADYRAIVETYGAGAFAGFLRVLTPFDPNRYCELRAASTETAAADRETRTKFPERYRFAIHPEPGGLLACATTDNGDTLYWLTEGAPDSWPVFAFESRALAGERFDGGLARFLTGWLAGSLACDAIAPAEAATFQPSVVR